VHGVAEEEDEDGGPYKTKRGQVPTPRNGVRGGCASASTVLRMVPLPRPGRNFDRDGHAAAFSLAGKTISASGASRCSQL
jgi:hypothetical protein